MVLNFSTTTTTNTGTNTNSEHDGSAGVGGVFSSLVQDFLALFFTNPSSSIASLARMDTSGSSGLLHFSSREYVLFSFWKVGSTMGMIGSILMVILIAVLHEAIIGLRFFLDREILLSSAANNSQASSHRSRESLVYVNETANSTHRTGQGQSTASSDSQAGATRILLRHLRRVFSGQRMLQALLYAIQWTLFFILILIVVTFNGWLITAAIWGKAIGYLVFIGSPAMERVERLSAGVASPNGERGAELLTFSEARRNLKSY